MAEVVKETIVTQGDVASPVRSTTRKVETTSSQQTQNFVYFLFGLLEVLLAFRFVLKLTGANTASGFVRFIYGLTGILVWPFEGIFHRGFAQGVETTAVFEPSTVVAFAVYAVLCWGVIKLISISSGEPQA